MDDWQNGGFGLYIHWPFCQSKCPYCDFNSHVSAQIDQRAWETAYLSEIDRIAAQTENRLLNTVFFGGGTPSLMDPDLVATLITRIKTRWTPANDLEITLEANPGSVEAARFRAFADAGVNRISMGIQALNDTDLKRLGRLHSATEARKAFDIARDAFARVSFDLIYARQHQTPEDWAKELREALSMAVDHLSLYQLTIEQGTAFGARHAAGGLKGLPDDDIAADMYLLTQEICAAHDMPAYEVSNHARDGAQSRHNLIYWRYGDYAGIGPGAHGRLTLNGTRTATSTPLMPQTWLDQVNTLGHGETVREVIPTEEQAVEYLMMSLRLREGTDIQRYQQLAGESLPAARIADLVDQGFLTRSDTHIATTDQGRPVLNALIRALML
ncbi:MAG: coproporphyrinogen III oxidase [Natronohydrobacter sp.]|nr:coproporphyrinogen III oxidase [Natronohydrobacter sp.]